MISGRLFRNTSRQRSRTLAAHGVTPAGCSTASCMFSRPGVPGLMYQRNMVRNQRFTGTTSNSARKECTRQSPLTFSDPDTRSKKRSPPLCDRYEGYPGEKRGSIGYDGYKKVNGNKLSALVDRNGLPLACTVAPANVHDSRLYKLTLEAFEISEVQERPAIISADAAYDAREIRQYNRKRRIKRTIPVNWRFWKHPKQGRPIWFDPILYKKRSAVKRFFSWIEAFKKITPRYERYEHSLMGLIHLACVVMIGRILVAPQIL